MGGDTYNAPRHGWCCFHCGDHFPNTEAGQQAAREHFGPTPDWKPECIDRWKSSTNELLSRTREAEAAVLQFDDARSQAQEEAEALHCQLGAWRQRFRKHTSEEAWNEYEHMQGRALAAEAVLIELQATQPDSVLAARIKVAGPGEYYPLTAQPRLAAVGPIAADGSDC